MWRAVVGVVLSLVFLGSTGSGADELRFYLRSDPETFDPGLVDDDASEAVRYLTGGVLIRVNRQTQRAEAELATAWKVTPDSHTITFQLRRGVRFSNGTPFTAADVKYTMDALMDPAVHSPTGDAFRSGQGRVNTVERVSCR